MGMAPDQVDRMTFWQFAACVAGWNRSHGAGQAESTYPTDREFEDALMRLH